MLADGAPVASDKYSFVATSRAIFYGADSDRPERLTSLFHSDRNTMFWYSDTFWNGTIVIILDSCD